MTSVARIVPGREPLHGLRQIVRFNWTFYAAGVAFAIVTWTLLQRLPGGPVVQGIGHLAAVLTSFWLVASLAASWVVYDRSSLMKGDWILAALGSRPAQWINIHAGLDETTAVLRRVFQGSPGRVFDIFDPREMSEPSIARARRIARGAMASERVDFRRLPAPSKTADAILLLAAHELRTNEPRAALFAEISRVLTAGGRVIVAEHLRDWPNFVVFGPGFLHFHSRRTWTRSFAQTGFVIEKEFSITPFVRVFVLRPTL